MTGTLARGKQVARRRVALHLTQEGLARLCRCTLRTIQRAEDGQNISVRTARILHAKLGIPLATLVAERGSR